MGPRDQRKCHSGLLSVAMYNWMVPGLSAVFRGIEWAQEAKGKVKCATMQLEKGPPPEFLHMAVTLGDFVFLDKHECPLLGQTQSCAIYVVIKWRTQKNNINSQLVTFGRAKTAFLCPVRAAVRIQEKAERLQHPLGMLGVSSAGPTVKNDANKHLRACATQVYGYTAKK